MSTCRHCGQEIEFRHIDGRCVPIHEFGGCEDTNAGEPGRKRIWVKCPKCGNMAYRVEHNGGIAWFDQLGLPWPKHKCFDVESIHVNPSTLLAVGGSSQSHPQLGTNQNALPKAGTLPSPDSAKRVVIAPPGWEDILVDCDICAKKTTLGRLDEHLLRVHDIGARQVGPESHLEAFRTEAKQTAKATDSAVALLLHKQSRSETIGPVAPARKRDRRKCEFCSAMVKHQRYSKHLDKVHRKNAAKELIDAAPKLVIHGSLGIKKELQSNDLRELPQYALEQNQRDRRVQLQAVLLIDVLRFVAPSTGTQSQGALANSYVVVNGGGKQPVVFSLAELHPTFSERKVYLVYSEDGRQLPPEKGPFRIIVPGEKSRARWMRGVFAVYVKEAS